MARSQGHNREAYQEKMKNEINLLLRRDLADPRLTMVSVTRVELTNDYSLATVYWDTFNSGERGDLKKALKGVSPKVRSLLAKNLQVRHTPAIKFVYDSQYEDELNIHQILKSENQSDDE